MKPSEDFEGFLAEAISGLVRARRLNLTEQETWAMFTFVAGWCPEGAEAALDMIETTRIQAAELAAARAATEPAPPAATETQERVG